MRQLDEAVADWTKAIELNSQFAAPYYRRGRARAILGKTEEGERDLQKAVELNSAFREDVNKLLSKMNELNERSKVTN